jgi:hypothetical protein
MKKFAKLGLVSYLQVAKLLESTYRQMFVSGKEKMEKLIKESYLTVEPFALLGTTEVPPISLVGMQESVYLEGTDVQLQLVDCTNWVEEVHDIPSLETMLLFSLQAEEPSEVSDKLISKFVRKNVVHVMLAVNTLLKMCEDLVSGSSAEIISYLTATTVDGKATRHTLIDLIEEGKQVFDAAMGIASIAEGNVFSFVTHGDKRLGMELCTFLKNLQFVDAPFYRAMTLWDFYQHNETCRRTFAVETPLWMVRTARVVQLFLGQAPQGWSKWKGALFYTGPGKTLMADGYAGDSFGAKYLSCIGDLMLPGWRRANRVSLPLEEPPQYGFAAKAEEAVRGNFSGGVYDMNDTGLEQSVFLSMEGVDESDWRIVKPDKDYTREASYCHVGAVPKSATAFRGVTSVNPLTAHFGQKFARECIEPTLKARTLPRLIVNNFDQEKQRRLCSLALDMNLATTDFSACSDLVSLKLWADALPFSWFRAAYSCRPTHVKIGNFVFTMYMGGPMGCSGTFDFMQVILISIAITAHLDTYCDPSIFWMPDDELWKAILEIADQFGVVGDDVISPCSSLSLFWERCEYYGLKVNRLKSFTEPSEVRESCGVFLIDGVCGEFVRFSRTFNPIDCEDENAVLNWVESVDSIVQLQHRLFRLYPSAAEYLRDVWALALRGRELSSSKPDSDSPDPWSYSDKAVVGEPAPVGANYLPTDSLYHESSGWGRVQRDAATRSHHWGQSVRYVSNLHLVGDEGNKKSVPVYTDDQVEVLNEYVDTEFYANGPSMLPIGKLATCDAFSRVDIDSFGDLSTPYVNGQHSRAVGRDIRKDDRLGAQKREWDLFQEA